MDDIAFVVDQEVAVVTVLEIERGEKKEEVGDGERGVGKKEGETVREVGGERLC
jgi:hypothetical protein